MIYTLLQYKDGSNQVCLESLSCAMNEEPIIYSTLTFVCNYVLFRPNDVKVYQNIKVLGILTMEGRRVESMYVMSTESAYVKKTQKNDIADLWHENLECVGNGKLNVVMKKRILKILPQLEVIKDAVCARWQYEKAHKLSFKEFDFKEKQPLELVYSDVFGHVKQPYIRGLWYMVMFIDDFSKYV